MPSLKIPPPLPSQPRSRPSENFKKRGSEPRNSVTVASAISAVVLLLLLAIFLSVLAHSRTSNSSNSPIAASDIQGEIKIGAEKDDKAEGPENQSVDPVEAQTKEALQRPDSSAADSLRSSDESIFSESEEVAESSLANQSLTAFPKYNGLSNGKGGKLLEPGSDNPFLSALDASSVVFVVDKSGSMAGSPLNRVIAALNEALDYLNADQKFMVLFFDDVMYELPDSTGLVAASSKNVRIYKKWMLSVASGGGGTQPWQAMFFALEQKPERVLILSDGEFNPIDVDRLTAVNQQDKKPSRIDAIGLSENVQTLRDLAHQNSGIYYQAR